MTDRKPALKSRKPKSIFKQNISVDLKALGIALAKGAAHALSGKFDDLIDDGADTLSAIGIEKDTPEVLLYVLLERSLTAAIVSLLTDSRDHFPVEVDTSALQSIVEASVENESVSVEFFSNPQGLSVVKKISTALNDWLIQNQVTSAVARSISDRYSGFFPFALHAEWQRHHAQYDVVFQNLATPFSQAANIESAWDVYSSKLHQRLSEGIFDEPFGLEQIYIPLNAFYERRLENSVVRVVVKLEEELHKWLLGRSKDDAVRVISGGPGSGKSSFARIFAANVAVKLKQKVLFIPLHLIDPSRDFVDEVGRFVKDEGILLHNPMSNDSDNGLLLIVLDGLDELASQGKAAAATARNFVRAVQQTVDRRNLSGLKLRVLFSGREVVLQESESEFRREGQILTILPYFLKNSGEYHDSTNLLSIDLRDAWWKNYGELIGESFSGLPRELKRSDLDEITAQPLLNYLLALSFKRKKLDFSVGVNLNQIYEDLTEAVYERGYEGRRHASVRDLKIEDFFLILEQIGLAAWQGDGRSTTVAEIESHCIEGGLANQLEVFQDGAKQGITQLLAAFFFRQNGERAKGDRTFVFTHKSFGEYLAARRIVHAMQDVAEEMHRRAIVGRGKGWSEADALERWVKWCGPTAMSRFIHQFLLDELKLMSIADVRNMHVYFVRIFNYILRDGMPLERMQWRSFREAKFYSRNAEESVFVAMNACARVLQEISLIEHSTTTSFAEWFKAIQGQRSGSASVLAASCLSWLNLDDATLHFVDFYGADLSNSTLRNIFGRGLVFEDANLESCNLERAHLLRGRFHGASLINANLAQAELERADFSEADLGNAILDRSTLWGINLDGASLRGASLKNVNISDDSLSQVDVSSMKNFTPTKNKRRLKIGRNNKLGHE